MNNKIIKIIIPFLLLVTIGTVSFALSEGILINDETFSFINKEEKIFSNFDSEFEVTNNSNNENNELKQTITELTKKTTYLLLGETNNRHESSENYFKRHHDYLDLRYDPEIPKDENSYLGLDENSQEYKDDILSGWCVPGIFSMINELGISYNSYGNIRVSIVSDEIVISSITLPDVTMKEQDTENPMKYNYIKTDLTMVYYFKKLNDEYKLLYLYGETNNDIEEYMNKSNEKTGELSKDSDYNSQLGSVYDFSKANAITDDTLTKIYNENKSKIVFLNSTYSTGSIASANGFFINEGIIITTYNYLEKSLMKAQNVIISDSSGNTYELDGIVTMNVENDIAILKVKNKNEASITVEDVNKIQKEDAVISLNSKMGIGLTTSKGIITATDSNIQTSLPATEEIQGSPIFNSEGQLIGMINSKTFNASISFATNIDILREYYNKLKTKNYDDIKAVPFNEIKENYYIKYNEEMIINNIPKNKLEEYSNVENIDNMIGLKLVKGSYKDNIISLRYKNDISDYIDTMQFASEYRENLKNKGYKEKNISDSKVMYENNEYQIILMTEFDYLIIVMVRI